MTPLDLVPHLEEVLTTQPEDEVDARLEVEALEGDLAHPDVEARLRPSVYSGTRMLADTPQEQTRLLLLAGCQVMAPLEIKGPAATRMIFRAITETFLVCFVKMAAHFSKPTFFSSSKLRFFFFFCKDLNFQNYKQHVTLFFITRMFDQYIKTVSFT